MGSGGSTNLSEEVYDEEAARAIVGAEHFQPERFAALSSPSGHITQSQLAAAINHQLASSIGSSRIADPENAETVPFGIHLSIRTAATNVDVGVPCTVSAQKAETAVHRGIRCDACGVDPIVGARWSRGAVNLCGADYAKLDEGDRVGYVLTAVHVGMRCDCCGQLPIVGRRFTREAAQYTPQQFDLCEADYAALNPEARADFVAIEAPMPLEEIVARTVAKQAASLGCDHLKLRYTPAGGGGVDALLDAR